jgi:hypothetical protein
MGMKKNRLMVILLSLSSVIMAFETKEEVRTFLVEHVEGECRNLCDSMQNYTTRCVADCAYRHKAQVGNFLARKYTAKCEDKEFTDRFLLVALPEDIAHDKEQTQKAIIKWQQGHIGRCVAEHFDNFNKHADDLIEERSRKNYPIRNWIRDIKNRFIGR